MSIVGNYLLQMSCWLAAFWLVYFVVLRHETYFKVNRWFLNIGLIFSSIMPLIPITYKVQIAAQPITAAISDTFVTSTDSTALNLNYWLIAYLTGIAFYISRFIWQHTNLYLIRKKSQSILIDSLKVHRIDEDTAPFSFINRIYVSSKLKSKTELETVVAHEKVHIIERHWADLLLLEMVRAIQWFNPLTQLYRKAIMQNHEYLADSGTIEFGVSARTYQAVLANQMLGIQVVNFANSFTFMNSQNRLKMMKRNKSNPINTLKLLLILPLITIILVSFAKPKYELITNSNSENVTLYESLENPSVIINKSELEPMQDASVKTIKIKGKVLNENNEPLPGASIHISNTTKGTVCNMKGEFVVDGVDPGSSFTISFVGYETIVSKAKANEYVTFKMEPSVVEIRVGKRLLSQPTAPAKSIAIKSTNGNDEKPLIVLDGDIYTSDMESIAPESIEKVEVVKDASATGLYGDAGKNGVIIITSKKESNLPPPTQDVFLNQFEGKKPLIFIDGKVHKMEVKKLFSEPDKFETINVLKGEAAIKKYGEIATDGAIEITTRMAAKNKRAEEVFVIVEDMPKYPGGKKALDKYIQKEAEKINQNGSAYVTFVVMPDGTISGIKTIRSSNKKLAKPAENIVKGMKNWSPGKQRGKPVKVQYTVKIEF